MPRNFVLHIREELALNKIAQITFREIGIQTPLNKIDFETESNYIVGDGFSAMVSVEADDHYPAAYDHVGRYLLGEQFRRIVIFIEEGLDAQMEYNPAGYHNVVRAALNWLPQACDFALTYQYERVLLARVGGELYINDGGTWTFGDVSLSTLQYAYTLRSFPVL